MSTDGKLSALTSQLAAVHSHLAPSLHLALFMLTYDVWLERQISRDLPRQVEVPALLLEPPQVPRMATFVAVGSKSSG